MVTGVVQLNTFGSFVGSVQEWASRLPSVHLWDQWGVQEKLHDIATWHYMTLKSFLSDPHCQAYDQNSRGCYHFQNSTFKKWEQQHARQMVFFHDKGQITVKTQLKNNQCQLVGLMELFEPILVIETCLQNTKLDFGWFKRNAHWKDLVCLYL